MTLYGQALTAEQVTRLVSAERQLGDASFVSLARIIATPVAQPAEPRSGNAEYRCTHIAVTAGTQPGREPTDGHWTARSNCLGPISSPIENSNIQPVSIAIGGDYDWLDGVAATPEVTDAEFARWVFNSIPAGEYTIFTSWLPGTDRATDATYRWRTVNNQGSFSDWQEVAGSINGSGPPAPSLAWRTGDRWARSQCNLARQPSISCSRLWEMGC